MDIHLIPGAIPSESERDVVDAFLATQDTWDHSPFALGADDRTVHGGHAGRNRRHLLLPTLRTVQNRFGHISRGAMNYLCERLNVPPAEAYGVASFYALLTLEPAPPLVVHVCNDLACHLNGADRLCAILTEQFGPAGKPGADGAAMWKTSPCLGLCECSPAAYVQQAGESPVETVLTSATSESILGTLRGHPVTEIDRQSGKGHPSAPQTMGAERSALRLLTRVGRVDPDSLDDYRASGGFAALRLAFEMGPNGILREVTDSGLQGRGGAAFPTGRKWQAVASSPVHPHYLVANADESESGTFKDRLLMEADPFALIESMTIAGFATGCKQGYVYIRGEYPHAAQRIQHAIDSSRNRGFLGANILDQGVEFDIEVRQGAGAYICGEETALFNSIEGFRGEPRNKPPFPTEAGLFGKPTVVNNVETLYSVLGIILSGGGAFARSGTAGSKGTKLFCVSGHVEHPGVYELPFGATLRDLLGQSGGVRGGASLQAVLLGGAAGSFLTPDELDVALTYEGTRAIGASLGSGVVMVLDERVDLQDFVLRIAAFFRDESCGQCVPCRVGTQRQEEALLRLASGATNGTRQNEIRLIDDIARVMRDASICGLGTTASVAVQSAIAKFGVFQHDR